MATQFRFEENEKVLCYHGPLLYEAKVLLRELRDDNTPRYRIHYNGWNKSWDEWIDDTRVLKFTEENLQRQKELLESFSYSKKKVDRKDLKRKPAEKEEDAKKKNKRRAKSLNDVETEEEFLQKVEVHLPIPDNLRRQLIRDWDLVTYQKKMVPLPRTPNVAQILDEYLNSKAKLSDSSDGVVAEVVEGLRTYFDQALGMLLLYRLERAEYTDQLNQQPDQPMSSVYGAEHLLRLFVKLPTLLAHTNIDEETLQVLTQHLQDFLKYLDKNRSKLFCEEYTSASPEYLRLAQL